MAQIVDFYDIHILTLTQADVKAILDKVIATEVKPQKTIALIEAYEHTSATN